MTRSEAVPAFAGLFGREPELRASAPGRVNLIGEHTDYNGGLVLPVAIPQRAVVEVARRTDDRVRVASDDVEPRGVVREYRLGTEARGGDWLDYVQGCTQALRRAARAVGGFEARIASKVPAGSGLASSAALCVALLRALRATFALELDDRALARAAHAAEFDFVGARVGVMDQMAASLGEPGHALLLDTTSLTCERVPLPATLELLVIDSGVSHRHADGGYNTRRAECEAARDALGVRSLASLGPDDLPRAASLPEPLGRRVRHVVSENARVVATVAALRSGEVVRLGPLFRASHASMRDDYQVSVEAVDRLVALAEATEGVHGARLTGGGFGGAVVIAARPGTARASAASLLRAYADATGHRPTLLVGDVMTAQPSTE